MLVSLPFAVTTSLEAVTHGQCDARPTDILYIPGQRASPWPHDSWPRPRPAWPRGLVVSEVLLKWLVTLTLKI